MMKGTRTVPTAVHSKSGFLQIYQQAFAMLKENPTVLMLFAASATIDFFVLGLLFLAPSEPVSKVLAPLIRTFYADRFLHYPDNFILLPKLYDHAHFVVVTLIGILISGVVIKKIEAYTQDQKLSLVSALRPVFKKYFSLLAAWLLSYGIFNFLLRRFLAIVPATLSIQFGSTLLTGIFFQALFSYFFQSILLTGRGLLKDLAGAITFALANFTTTFCLLAGPIFLMLVLAFLKALPPLFNRFDPEWTLWVLAGGIIVSTVVDMMITSTTTLLFLKARSPS